MPWVLVSRRFRGIPKNYATPEAFQATVRAATGTAPMMTQKHTREGHDQILDETGVVLEWRDVTKPTKGGKKGRKP